MIELIFLLFGALRVSENMYKSDGLYIALFKKDKAAQSIFIVVSFYGRMKWLAACVSLRIGKNCFPAEAFARRM